jgi:hypothetical protein
VTKASRPAYCEQCGSPAQEGERFCGVCGAAVLPPAPRAERVVPEPAAAAQGSATRTVRKPPLLVAIAAILLVLLAVGAALALAGLGPGDGLLGGGSEPPQQPSANGETSPSQPEETGASTATESTTPSPTTVDLVQRFVSGYYEALSREDWAATYSMLDEESQQKVTEEEWTRAQASLAASDDFFPIASATVEGPYVSEARVPFTIEVTVTHEDGTSEIREVTLVSAHAVDDVGDFRRHLTDGELSYLRGALVEGSAGESATPASSAGPESTTPGLQPEGADQVREAVQQYYYAVDHEEWDYTYHDLDLESRVLFSEDEWIEKNRWYADHEDLKVDSMNIAVVMEGEKEASVTVDRTFQDGIFISRDTRFAWEDGWWRHHLTDEEKKIFMPGLSYEEFVAAQR